MLLALTLTGAVSSPAPAAPHPGRPPIATRVTLTARPPVRRGQPVGTAVFISQGREVARVTLNADQDVRLRSWWSRLLRWLRR